MSKIFNLTEGPILRNLLQFSMPLILTNVLQAVYNVADMAIAGHFTSPVGMTAINTSGQVTTIILMIIIGFTNGTNIVTGQLIGSGKEKEIRKVIRTTLPLFALLAIIITLAVGSLSAPLLRILNMPAEAFTHARSYLLICLCGTIFIYIYNTLAAVLRGMGDSKRPLLFMVISTLTNIALDYIFMGPLQLGVSGAALATIIAQALSMIMIVFYFWKNTEYLSFSRGEPLLNKQILKMILKIGLPQACQFSATQISFLIIAGMVNVYGVTAAAAVGAANKAGTFAQLPGQALNVGVLTTTAQNLPKKNYKRILQSMGWAMGIGVSIASVFLIVAILSPATILGFFTDNQNVIATGAFYLTLMSIGFVIENVIYTSSGVISGAGYTPITMLGAVSAAIGRIVFAILLQNFTDFGFYSIGIAAVLCPIIPVIIMVSVLFSGKWKISRIQRDMNSLQ